MITLYKFSNIQFTAFGYRNGGVVGVEVDISSWYLVMVVRLFLAMPWVRLRFVIVVFPDHTHYFRNPTTRHHGEKK